MWLLILALIGALLYVNQVGLPGFLKRPLLEKLRARGVDLQFSRLRLRWYHGLVAENVHFGRADDPLSPYLTVREAQLRLNYHALSRLKLQVDALVLRQGRLVLPLPGTNQVRAPLTITNIQTDLSFLSGDQWSLDNFKAEFAGAGIRLSGVITNASAVRDWQFLKRTPGEGPSAARWQQRLNRLGNALELIRFSSPPELIIDVRGDARDLQSFGALVLLTAPGADTPWANVSQGRFTARILPADTNRLSRARLSLEADYATTRWGEITNVAVELNFNSREKEDDQIEGRLKLSAERVSTEWAAATNAIVVAHWMHSITNPIPLSGEGHVECGAVGSRWGNARRAQLNLTLQTPPAEARTAVDPSTALWTNLAPYILSWQCRAEALDCPQVQATLFSCGGEWHAPQLTVTNLEARLYNGRLDALARLNIATRELSATLKSDFDVHKLSGLLTEGGRHWLEPYVWVRPPDLRGDILVTLPAWTNHQPDWRAEVLPTLQLRGEFDIKEGGTYRQVPVSAVRSHFTYSNLTWHLPDLTLTRPEGIVRAEHRANDRTKQFYWHLAGTADPEILRPVLQPAELRGLDLFTFSQPPVFEAEVWGHFHDPQQTGFKGQCALTNFSFRGEQISSVGTSMRYTNRVLEFFAPRIECGTQHVSADGLTADFNAERVYLTNGYSTADPMLIARAIGPKIAHVIEPYQFLRPPTAHVRGTIPLRGEEGADLHFFLEGGPFHWWKFNLPEISGHVHWAGLLVKLSEVSMDFYGGRAAGSAEFDVTPGRPTEFHFNVGTTNSLLHALMGDLVRSNRLEGRLTANLDVTRASTADWHTVNGYGNLELRDGVIWDIPLFGIFSPVLNGIVPGLGNSRATAGTCTFLLTNGVLSSNDLEIRSSGMRLDYRGTVDLETRLNAKVDAELLRDMWVIGPLVSTVFWPVTKLFEYKVTGVLHDPKMEPVFIIPKLVLMPFHPFRTIKGLFPEDTSRTNAPTVH